MTPLNLIFCLLCSTSAAGAIKTEQQVNQRNLNTAPTANRRKARPSSRWVTAGLCHLISNNNNKKKKKVLDSRQQSLWLSSNRLWGDRRVSPWETAWYLRPCSFHFLEKKANRKSLCLFFLCSVWKFVQKFGSLTTKNLTYLLQSVFVVVVFLILIRLTAPYSVNCRLS